LATYVVPIMAEMSMSPGSCASMLQRQRTLNQTALPEVQMDDRIWSSQCFASSSCVYLLALLLLAGAMVHMVAKVPSEVQAAKSSRNPHVDNAKFLGMVLVCWSHLGAWFLKGGRVDIASSDVIWFHMPLFVFLSGSFVRPFSRQLLIKTFVTLVMPLVFFIFILFPMSIILAFGRSENPLLHQDPTYESSVWDALTGCGPGWYIWFLRCLILWRVVSMFTCQLSKSIQISLAVTSACVGIYLPAPRNPHDLGIFAIQRALCLFPIFVMGQHVDLGRFLQAIPGASKASSPCVLVTWTLILSLIYMENRPEWRMVTFGAFDVMATKPIPFLRYPSVPSCPEDYYFMWARLFACLGYRVLCMFLFLLFGVPREKTWFTQSGSRTIYAYLLHYPFVLLINKALCWCANYHGLELFGPSKSMEYFHFMRLAFFLTCCFVLVVYGLTSQPVVVLFGPLIEPTWIQRIFRQDSQSPKEVG